jgi:hypothetical protein
MKEPLQQAEYCGFAWLMRLQNRKQVPVCRECHRKIHRGEGSRAPVVAHTIFDPLGNKLHLYEQSITQLENSAVKPRSPGFWRVDLFHDYSLF